MFRAFKNRLRDAKYRRIYPDLYDDTLHRERLAVLADKLNCRTVAVVGNAESVFAMKSGQSIDSCETVIRINRGFVRDAASQGSRTDVLCLATNVTADQIAEEYGAPEIVFVTPNRWGLADSLLARRDAFACFPLDEWTILSELMHGERPSAGLITIYIARHIFKAETVSLFGFDWKATKTFYSTSLRRHHHNWGAEKDLITEWTEQGWLRLPPRAC